MISLFSFGQTYQAQWKKVAEAEQKDLPQTAYQHLQEVVKKATKEKAYGQLLKAELKGAQVMAGVAPDSLKTALERMEARCEQTDDDVLKTIWQTVLYSIYAENHTLGRAYPKPELDERLCGLLGAVTDATYQPMVLREEDSQVFGHDLLSVVGYELKDYQTLYHYYSTHGNRKAACIVAAKAFQNAPTEQVDSVLALYEDLTEAGEIAILRYRTMSGNPEAQVDYIKKALGKWGSWPRMGTLRNEMKRLTNPQMQLSAHQKVNRPGQPLTVELTDLRNVQHLALKVWRVKANGDLTSDPNTKEGYQRIKPLLGEAALSYGRSYEGRQAYELFSDTLTVEGLPVGVYMLELTDGGGQMSPIRALYYVTDVFTIAQGHPDHKGVRYVVVNATTGQPIAGAHLRITSKRNYSSKKTTVEGVTDVQGEYLLTGDGQSRWHEVYAYTDTDAACPEMSLANQYGYYESQSEGKRTCIYTDRSIYRPGQTVHVAAIVYQGGGETGQLAVEGYKTMVTLRDANYKIVGEKRVVTDRHGVCTADFTLPGAALTGQFCVQVGDNTYYFRVEEYKRPTFEVSFEPVTENYQAGDTLSVKAQARSYAGVAVQGARVNYKVERRMPFWWWNYSRYWGTGLAGHGALTEEVCTGSATTAGDGTFDVILPLEVPETDHPMFYQFVVTADVTDMGGETHSGEYVLPLGNRKTALTVDLKEQVLAEDRPSMIFHLRNAAGNETDATVRYQIDGGRWQTAQTNKTLPIAQSSLKSGKHTLLAECDSERVERSFVVFSLEDKHPATETKDWFYLSDAQFPNDGRPVTLQVGSSDRDVHIVYSIFSGNTIVEKGALDRSNELINRKLTYREEWGNGILLTFAWVKEGQCYTHTATIKKPLPEKRLRLEWTTFRDRLTPGQQEEWTLTVRQPSGKPADAHLIATLYDKSLDQLAHHDWTLFPEVYLALPSANWSYNHDPGLYGTAYHNWRSAKVKELSLSHFDHSVYPSIMVYSLGYSKNSVRLSQSRSLAAPMAAKMHEDASYLAAGVSAEVNANDALEEKAPKGEQPIQLRENLNETAFFYPDLTTDGNGCISLKFTLPESLTTWRFLSVAHTADMMYGSLTGEAVAKKDVMIQPNVPRFVRMGDDARVSARVFNTSDHAISGTALLRLKDPETDAILYEAEQHVDLQVDATTVVSWQLPELPSSTPLLVCQVMACGDGFSDGEQHYLPVLPSTERVTVAMPFTQTVPGTKQYDLSGLIDATGKDGKLAVEYTSTPAWLMIQALPSVGIPSGDNAVSLAAAYYANVLGQHIVEQNPHVRKAFDLWKQEAGTETSLMSALQKNQELKDIVLNETPWVQQAEHEAGQKQQLAEFFDGNTIEHRLVTISDKLRKLQFESGAWTWWPGMPESFSITVTVGEMLVRLNALTGHRSETAQMLDKAFDYMGTNIVKTVDEMRKEEKKGHLQTFPSFNTLQWLYLCAIDSRELPERVQEANRYLLKLLKKDIKRQSIYEKALTAVILAQTEPKRAAEYVESLKEYTVYQENMGCYYDTPRAGYSWFDYKIPTQTAAIEAIQQLTPEDHRTIAEMQHWLLQEKRAQAWNTPINSVNAIYAFLRDRQPMEISSDSPSTLCIDGRPLEIPRATAALGYVKTSIPVESKTLTVEKSSEGTSWGVVYAQYMQQTKDVTSSGSGMTVKRELRKDGKPLTGAIRVGDRLTVHITITAERDLDFVQVSDRRAACLEPVSQLSGYHHGAYCTPHDNVTNYFYYGLAKGIHEIETEYFVDREGLYETGSCIVECAYAPEFRAIAPSKTISVVQ